VTWIDFFARWRVRIGYILAILVLWLARPAPLWILAGGAVGLFGLLIRGYAAGYLHKQEVLGAAIAMHSSWSTALLLLYFALVYSLVMRREEMELRIKHGAAFDTYAARVPLFFPRVVVENAEAQGGSAAFSWARYKKNHEYEAAVGFLFLLVALMVIWRLRGA
jgi:hypothetical protein